MAAVVGVDRGRATAALGVRQDLSVIEQWYILIQITNHWMVYTRDDPDERQMFNTEEAANIIAGALRKRKGKNGQPVYKSVLVKAL